MKRRNPSWGCPRIAQEIALAFGISINKDVVRRILAVWHHPKPDAAGPSWLTVLGHAKDSLWGVDLHVALENPDANASGVLLESYQRFWKPF